MAVKGDVYNETKDNCECDIRFRSGDFTPHLTSVDIGEIVRIGGVKNFMKDLFVTISTIIVFWRVGLDMTSKRNEYKEQGKSILQDLCKKSLTELTEDAFDVIFMMF